MTSPLPMTAGRWVALAIGTPLALLAIGWTALTAVAWAGLGSYRVNLAAPVHGTAVVAVGVDSGDVTVRPGPAGQIKVHGILRYSLIRPQVSWQRTPSAVTLHSRCRVLVGECSLSYAVTVPPLGRTEISVADGDLAASGLAGTVTLASDAGDIRAARISGEATITDHSGDIVVSSLSSARALITDDSGNISGNGVSSPDLTVQDSSGDITMVFTRVPARVRVSDDSGNITLVLPPGPTAYRVDASTRSGVTTVAVPRNPSSAHVITVTDQSGDITVTR
jgi:Putative adhesin